MNRRSVALSRRAVLLGGAALPFGLGRTAQAQSLLTPVDVELVLAADGSGSIDDAELTLQRQGYAEALQSVPVLNAIQSGLHGAIALAYVEWGGPSSQHTIVEWQRISDAQSAAAFGEALVARPRAAFGYNSISNAIHYSRRLIDTSPFQGLKRVIDVSADGPNIGGRPIMAVRNETVAAGITINALLVARDGGAWTARPAASLQAHYDRDVIGGPGAFVMVAGGATSFAEAVRRKMVLEIAGPMRKARTVS